MSAGSRQAVAVLIKSLEQTDSACLQLGQLLLVKHGGNVFVRTLSPDELARLEQDPDRVLKPGEILIWLKQKDSPALPVGPKVDALPPNDEDEPK